MVAVRCETHLAFCGGASRIRLALRCYIFSIAVTWITLRRQDYSSLRSNLKQRHIRTRLLLITEFIVRLADRHIPSTILAALET